MIEFIPLLGRRELKHWAEPSDPQLAERVHVAAGGNAPTGYFLVEPPRRSAYLPEGRPGGVRLGYRRRHGCLFDHDALAGPAWPSQSVARG
jgi:hypothetical protein